MSDYDRIRERHKNLVQEGFPELDRLAQYDRFTMRAAVDPHVMAEYEATIRRITQEVREAQDEHIRQRLIAAGWSPPGQVVAKERQLAEMAAGAFVRDASGHTFFHHEFGDRLIATWTCEHGELWTPVEIWDESDHPLRIVHQPR